MKYYPIHMHLHCSHEASASLGSHMSKAKPLGIDYLWTTEHDTRIGKPHGKYFSFKFLQKSLYGETIGGRTAGFIETEDNGGEYSFKDEENEVSLLILAKEGERETLRFGSKGKKHSDPLFSLLTVEMDCDIAVKVGGRASVEFILSAQPPSYRQARLCYYVGEAPEKEEGEPILFLPFPEKKDGKYVFRLFEDTNEEIGGLDNALCSIDFKAENGGEILLRSMDFYREREYEKTRQAQKELAERIGKKWGVKAFVGFEVTGAGNHKNCFSTTVPVIDYSAYDYKVSNEEAIRYLQSHGATYSWNHPFTIMAKSGKGKEEIFNSVKEDLIKNKVYGASLLEVGFPFGRDGFESKDYLNLWDSLTKSGIIITGYGDSDNHHATADGWTEGNNFCGFAGIEDGEEPTEENFVKAFKRGSLWSGNPVKIKNLSFSGGGKEQGSILEGESVEISLSAKDIKCGGYAVLINNGKETARVSIDRGKVEAKWTLDCEEKYNFARAEIYDENGVLIAFTNPIYLVKGKEVFGR